MKNDKIRSNLAQMIRAMRSDPTRLFGNTARVVVNLKLARDVVLRTEVIPVTSFSFNEISHRVDKFCALHGVTPRDVFLGTTTVDVPYEEWEEDAIELTANTSETDQEWYDRIRGMYKDWEHAGDQKDQIVKWVEGPWQVDVWRKGQPDEKLVVQAAHGDADLALVLNGNFDSPCCDEAKSVAQYIADVLNATSGWTTADGVVVKPGDKVWVRSISGPQQTTVRWPVANHDYLGLTPVSRSYSNEQALQVAMGGA